MIKTKHSISNAKELESSYYFWLTYENEYFEIRKKGKTGSLKHFHKLYLTGEEMIKTYCLVRAKLSSEQIFNIIQYQDDRFTLNKLNDVIDGINNFKVDYWIRKQKGNKYEKVVEFYGLSDIMKKEVQ